MIYGYEILFVYLSNKINIRDVSFMWEDCDGTQAEKSS